MTSEERMALAKRIAKHEAPTQKPRVDRELLTQSAARLQRCEEVLLAMPCSKLKN
jgi:hypothetical protein